MANEALDIVSAVIDILDLSVRLSDSESEAKPKHLAGTVQKLKGVLYDDLPVDVHYHLPVDNQFLHLNPLLGKTINLSFSGIIHCRGCNRKIKKSFQQGYCFPCTQTLASCDICIVRPEKCHHHLGTCREPEWAKTHCMIPHIVYLANTSGLKVGITRETQIPTRWIDQGASQALPIARVSNRYHAGLLEVAIAKNLADKTDWRKMLKGEAPPVDLEAKRAEILSQIPNLLETPADGKMVIEPLETSSIQSLYYPLLSSPAKIVSLNLDKTPEISGTLLGIKGQYLIFDTGVLNVRNIGGYQLTIDIN